MAELKNEDSDDFAIALDTVGDRLQIREMTGLEGRERRDFIVEAIHAAVAWWNDYDGRAEMPSPRVAPKDTVDLMSVYKEYAEAAGIKGEAEMREFVDKALANAISNLNEEADKNNPNVRIAGLKKELEDKKSEVQKAEEALAQANRDIAELKKRATEATQQLDEANRRLAELKAQAETPTTKTQIAEAEADVAKASETRAKELAEIEKTSLHAATLAGEVRKAVSDLAQKIDEKPTEEKEWVSPEWHEKTATNRTKEEMEEDDTAGACVDPNFDWGDVDARVDAEGGTVPDLRPDLTDNGTSVPAVGLVDGDLYVGSNLTWEQGKAGFAITLRVMLAEGLPVDKEEYASAIRKMFPALPTTDMHLLLRVFDDAVANRGRLSWDELASRGISFTYEEDEKEDNEGVDTASGDRQFDRNAARELTSKDLQTFLSLARYAAPTTGANLQGFLVAMRETIARQVEADPNDESSSFLDNIVNPRRRWMFEGRELKSYNEREAVFHYVLGQAISGGKVADYLKGQWKKGNTGAFLLSYLSAMDEGSRSRFAQLIANAASCDPAHYQRVKEGDDAGTMDPTDNAGKRTNLAAVAGSLAGLVGKKHSTVLTNARSLRIKVERADERDLDRAGGRLPELKRVPGPKEPLSVREALDAIDHNRFIIADMIAKALESQENPICDILRSDTLMSYLRRIGGNKGSKARELDVQNIRDLARALSVQEAYRADRGYHLSVPFAAQVADAMEIVGASKIFHEIALEDAETAALAVFTSGSSVADYGALSEKSLRFSGPILLMFNYYTESLPHTVMNKEIDRFRMGDPGSIAITSRGVIPILARWMDDASGFRKIVDEVFAAEVKQAQDRAEREFVQRYRKETATDAMPSAEEILQVRDGAKEELLGKCRQEMVWPDGTRILAKNITEGFDATEVYDACRRSYSKMRQGGAFFVPVYAGDHSSSVLLQIPYRVGERAKEGETFSERELDELSLDEIKRDALAKDKVWKDPRVRGEARKAAKKVADEAYRKYDKALSEFEKKYGDKFKAVADAISESIGLGLLGDDTKRSAISSLEQAGLSMVGVKVVDVPANTETGEPAHREVKFGHCHQHIFFNYKSRKTAQEGNKKSLGNEELKGTTLIAGYGAERQRECAKTRGTGTIKVHLISTAGRALSFIKSLCTTPKKQFGEFVEGDCKKVYYEKMQKGIDPEIDTAVGTDLDSLKIGDLTSKWLKVRGTDKSILEHIVDELDRKYGLSNDGKLPENLDLDEEFAGIEFDEAREGVAPATKLSDILPGIRVSMVEGVDGATIDIEYLDDGMTSYNVANVSHTSVATTGRAARNYEVDALTMAAAQIQESGSLNLASQMDVFSILQDWGIMASTVYGSRDLIGSLIRTSSGLRDLSVRGESPDGAAMKEELFRTAWARKRENLNVPVYGVDAPLVSAGAGASLVKDADGNILYDEKGRPRISLLSKSKMLRDLNYGSVVFTDAERKWYKTNRRLGLCAVNTQGLSFRYGWWLDQKAFDAAFLKGVENPTNRDRAEALERAIVEIHDAERETGKQRLDLRKALMSAFVDYHGLHLDEYAPHVAAVSFEDLFIADPSSGNGGRMFDRSAIQWDEQDLVHNDATGEAHVFLGGSAMWLPRTPSYNGSNWAQVVRASIPVTEVKRQVRGKDGMVEKYFAGRDAMVSPDPLTNEILGSDHAGARSRVAFLQATGTTGQVVFNEIPPAFEGLTGSELAAALDDFVKNGETRQKYLDLLRAKGIVTEKTDPATGETILGISETYRSGTSNRFVRAIMDMARQLPCPKAGNRRVSFLGGPASQATNTFPGSANEKEKLLDKKYDNPNSKKVIQKGHKLSESELAARVTAYANNANDARARAVSLAKSLHLAWASGFYNYGNRNLFHNLKSQDWYQFIHLIDGLSNATFDDIKEQLCMRLGWTKGMLSAFVTDLMLGYDRTTGAYATKLPTTQVEIDPLIEQYVDSVNGYGSRYYMMLTSADNDPHGIKGKAIQQIVLGKNYNNWADFFGIKVAESERGIEYFTGLDLTKQPDKERIGDFVARLASEVVKSDWAKEHGLSMSVSDALKSLAYGVRKGNNRNNPVPGYLFYLCKEAADAKDVAPEDAEGIARKIATTWVDSSKMTKERRDALLVEIGQFLKWSQTNVLLESAREFGNAFNYVAADPGSPRAANTERKIIEAGKRLLKDLENDPVAQVTPLLKKGLNFLDFFMKMHAVTRAAYASEYGLEPVSKAAKTWADDTPSLEFPAGRYGSLQDWIRTLASDHAGNENLARMAIGTYALDHLGDVSTGREVDEFGAEVSAQTRPFVIAALQTIGDRSPMENLEMLQRLADAERIASGGVNTPHMPENDIFHLLRAIETLFEVGKRLCSTSTEYYGKRTEGSAPYGYFFQRKETRFDKDGYPAAQGRYVIQSSFAGGTEVLVNEANRVIKRVRDGEALSGERIRAGFRLAGPIGWSKNKEKNADIKTKAKTFDLSDKNLENFLAELTSVAKDKTEGKVWMRDIRLAQGIVREFGTVTQKQLFDELIPFYIALTTRTVGAPSVQGASLLNLYRDVYAKWSDRQAKNQRIDPDLYNYSIATNFAPIKQNLAFSKKRTDGARALFKAESDVRALDKVPYGDIQEWRDAVWHARRAETLGGDQPTSKTGDVLIPRENPAGRYLTDVFAGDGMLAHLATYFQNPVGGIVSKESFGADLARRVKEGPFITEAWVDEKDVDPYARKLAYAMRALVGSWATVKFTGPKTFVIQGDLRSNVFAYSPNAARAIITVDVSDSATITSEEEVVSLASSPTYAASFVAVKGNALGIETVEDFMKLPFEARCELVRKYGIGAATLNKPSWTIDKRGMAVLCGAMRLGKSKAETQVYHEYFHAMVSMFNQLGVFSEEDVKAFQSAFGEPPAGTDMLFDEETAAERFRKFVEGKTEKNAKVRSVFARLFGFIKKLYATLTNGFRYSKMDGEAVENTLFSLILGGVAARSTDSLESLGKRAYDVANASDIALRLGGSVKNSALVRDLKTGTTRNATQEDIDQIRYDEEHKVPSKKRTVRYLSVKEAREHAVNHLNETLGRSLAERGYVGELVDTQQSTVENAAKLAESNAKGLELVELLKRDDIDESRVAQAIEEILGLRRTLDEDSQVYFDNTGRLLANIPENRVEQIRFASGFGTSPRRL